MHSALRIVAFSLAFLPGRISSSKICIPSCLRETTPHASSDIFQRKRAISFFSFFFLFPLEETGKKTRTKTQVDRSEAVEWNFQNDWDISKTRGCFGETTSYIEFTSKPDESMISNDEGMGQTSDGFKFRPIYLRNVTARGWKARSARYVAYILLRLLIASVRFK